MEALHILRSGNYVIIICNSGIERESAGTSLCLSINFAVGVEKVHVLVDGNAGIGSGFVNGHFIDLEVKFGLPELTILRIIHEQVPGCLLVAVDAMDNLFCCGVLSRCVTAIERSDFGLCVVTACRSQRS